MQKHPDADAFMRSYLEHPADEVARLVFADWLDETDKDHNAAWAQFIRLRIEADRHPLESAERRDLDREADKHAPHIRAKLTISAKLFVGYPKSLLQLLPAPNITVRLANFTVPIAVVELMPESVARENWLLPLDLQRQTLLVATADPRNSDTALKLQFILNKDIVFVRADQNDVLDAINRHYGLTETESVDSVLVEFVDTAIVFASTGPSVVQEDSPSSDAPVVRLVNLILGEATNLRADRILLAPESDVVRIRYRIDGAWIDRDSAPRRLLHPMTVRLAIVAGIPVEWAFVNPPSYTPINGECVVNLYAGRFRVRVTIQPSPDGPTTQLDLSRQPGIDL